MAYPEPAIDECSSELDRALALLRDQAAQQVGSAVPTVAGCDPETAARFAPDLPATLEPGRRRELLREAERLGPWLQGPFYLGGDLVIGGTWRNDLRWANLDARITSLAGKSVLDVGSNAGYDPFMFHLKGAAHVLACEPFAFHHQALFLESVYRTGVDFRQMGWQELDPARHGRFDLVHCHGVLYHEPRVIEMLLRLRAMMTDDGELFFGSMMLEDAELAEYVRFVPNAYHGDPTWWFVPGRLAMRWMLQACGFTLLDEFGHHDGPAGDFPVINAYFHCGAGQPAPDLLATGTHGRP